MARDKAQAALARERQRAESRHFVCEAHVPTDAEADHVCPCCEAMHERQRSEGLRAALRDLIVAAEPVPFAYVALHDALARATCALADAVEGETRDA